MTVMLLRSTHNITPVRKREGKDCSDEGISDYGTVPRNSCYH